MVAWVLDLMMRLFVVALCIGSAIHASYKDKPEQALLWWMMLIVYVIWVKLDYVIERINSIDSKIEDRK